MELREDNNDDDDERYHIINTRLLTLFLTILFSIFPFPYKQKLKLEKSWS